MKVSDGDDDSRVVVGAALDHVGNFLDLGPHGASWGVLCRLGLSE